MSDPAPGDGAVPPPPWERSPRRRASPARVPLTRERIVEAAYVVLDREGYDGLSMRQVAAELGVAVSGLYAHVAGKDEVLRLMYERLFEGHELPPPDPANWQEQVKDFAREGRRRLLLHRDMAKISMTHVPFTPELLVHVESLLAIFRVAGLPDTVAAAAGDVLSTFMDGFVHEESMWDERRRDSKAETWEEMRATIKGYFDALPHERFPNIVALSGKLFDESNDARFELALDIILRGLASYIPPGDAPPSR
ncbi:TetR/AcrR family transcriptional regulator [Sphaerisporangium sp. TRM90804]|uniref:TetR/AcrR family transcriptional regulator n=1 Tax=Sphaerisporangium sp. TRM90804 TaxID=3031113 RepID=UPI00244D1020|nr:TetR/AcrR family transcriptional regulator [Sphaerisporangium sp. TRM90804]MDH2427609.1 TetR/AcrR family transcriptional regulator [Sphaerisporangium sp. TRM90804]